MRKYIDAKVRFCPKCNQNVNDCQCQDNRVRFVQLSQAKYDELMQKENPHLVEPYARNYLKTNLTNS